MEDSDRTGDDDQRRWRRRGGDSREDGGDGVGTVEMTRDQVRLQLENSELERLVANRTSRNGGRDS
ncbi:hypothetical protein HanRHA438_Chr09g0373261 [Helianthus annuus]|nr:hypothetical protein HanRHA438_Chr09g0373261 [Helianthus annuus]